VSDRALAEHPVNSRSDEAPGGSVIDARLRFAPRRLERIVFDPVAQACRVQSMSVDELHSLIEIVKQQFDALLDERRQASASAASG